MLSRFKWYRRRKGGVWCLFSVEPAYDTLDVAFKQWVNVEYGFDARKAASYYTPPPGFSHELIDTEHYDEGR